MTSAVARGIDQLLRLDCPLSNSEIDLNRHESSTVDGFEILNALEVLREFFKTSAEMLGKPMYKGEKEFDFIHDIKGAIEGYFLAGVDQKQSALLRRKNRSMVVLMLNPIVDKFQHCSHEETLEQYDAIIDESIQFINDHDKDASPDDAYVVRRVIQKTMERKNRVQAAVDGILRLRRRKKKRKSKKK